MENVPVKKARKVRGSSTAEKPNTKLLSFTLYKDGKNISQIANERVLSMATIEGHLAHYIGTGEINVNDLVTEAKLLLIKVSIEKNGAENYKAIADECKQQVSYGEIRMVAASLKKHVNESLNQS